MNTFLAYIWRLIVILFGFSLATLSTALVYAAAWTMQNNLTAGAAMTAFDRAADFAILVLIAASFGGAFIVVPVLILVFLAETFNWRSLLLHACIGALLGAGATLFWVSGNVAGGDMRSTMSGATAGIIGACVYWLIAGRNAGKLFERVAAERRALNDQNAS